MPKVEPAGHLIAHVDCQHHRPRAGQFAGDQLGERRQVPPAETLPLVGPGRRRTRAALGSADGSAGDGVSSRTKKPAASPCSSRITNGCRRGSTSASGSVCTAAPLHGSCSGVGARDRTASRRVELTGTTITQTRSHAGARHRAHEAPHWPFLRMVSLWLPAWRSLNGSAVAVSVRACEHADDLDPVVILVDAV